MKQALIVMVMLMIELQVFLPLVPVLKNLPGPKKPKHQQENKHAEHAAGRKRDLSCALTTQHFPVDGKILRGRLAIS